METQRRLSVMGTVSSNGKVTTTQAETVITLTPPSNCLEVKAHDHDITVRFAINGITEKNVRLIEAGERLRFDRIPITGFVVIESGVTYSYSGAYY